MGVLKRIQEQTSTGRLLLLLGLTCLGAVVGWGFGNDRIDALITEPGYFTTVSVLLAIGLYGSAHGIDRRHLRRDLRPVLLAITVGVVLKAAIITGVMIWWWPGPEGLIVGVAVAQIDPLSVAALQRGSRMTARGKVLLLAWASFDDPVTTLLTIYAAGLAVNLRGIEASGRLADTGLADFAAGFALNLAVAAAVLALWSVFGLGRRKGNVAFVVSCVLLTTLLALAVVNFWMLAMALAGLFLRPVLGETKKFETALQNVTMAAFALTVLGVGLILSLGVELWAGMILGITAFAAQILVGRLLSRGQEPGDRTRLAIAQQNGITAMVLALLLLPVFPAIVSIVAPAVVVINLLNALTNAVYDYAGSLSPSAFTSWFGTLRKAGPAKPATVPLPADSQHAIKPSGRYDVPHVGVRTEPSYPARK